MLAYEATDGRASRSIDALNNYYRQSTGVINEGSCRPTA